MITDAISISGGAAAGDSAASRNAKRADAKLLNYDAFLKLLLAQMQNQDPLEPMKSSDYVAQLATFSQVEQSVQMNTGLSALLSATRLQQAEGLIGRTVTSADRGISGVVSSARILGDRVVAVLTDGREVRIDDGVTLSGSLA